LIGTILTPNHIGFVDSLSGQLVGFALQSLECVKMNLPVRSSVLERLIGRVYSWQLLP
jgi:hypothetical protein